MWEYFTRLFDTSDFPARWHCGYWTAGHGYLHIVSDVLIFGAYSAIPLVLLYFLWKRQDLPFPRIFWLFGIFIFACGTTHLLEAIIFYWPVYRAAGLLKLVTAVASWATVAALIPIIPRVLAIPGIARLNDQLQMEIHQRRRAETELRRVNQELAEAVALNVADLSRSRHHLQLAQHCARIGTWEISPETGEMSCSSELINLYGLHRTAEIGSVEHWLDHVHPDDRPRAARDLERAIDQQVPYESEFRIVRGDGTCSYILAQGRLRGFEVDGQQQHSLLGIHLDITQRQELEDALAVQVDEEKQRISQEIHDGVGQQLTGLGFLARSLYRSLEESNSPYSRQASELSSSIPEVVRNLREIVRGLMPVEVDAIGLMSALEQLADATSSRTQVPCTLECEGSVEVWNEQAAQQLFRIAQEAVHNAVKHSQATRIRIRLACTPDDVLLEVIDNGTGIIQPPALRRGMGMRILHHRAAKLGAALSIHSEKGRGTHVRCLWNRNAEGGRTSWRTVENPPRGRPSPGA